jgi:hypothetical protein
MLFIDCYAGEVGSLHDARIFTRSDFYAKVNSGEYKFEGDSHILGDNAYPISNRIMVPYPVRGVLNRAETNFNKRLSSSRVVIERAFGLLKKRFRRMKDLEMTRIDLIPLYIISCCILHNIGILERDWDWVEKEISDDSPESDESGCSSSSEDDEDIPEYLPNYPQARQIGQAKRLALAQALSL